MLPNIFLSDDTSITEQRKIYSYFPIAQTLFSEELGEYVSYGIFATRDEQTIALVSDVSTELEAVKELAARCTEHQLSPEHLSDVIEDFLAEPPLLSCDIPPH